ncbi:MAG: EAL domain-containing protein [Lautropia sp.]
MAPEFGYAFQPIVDLDARCVVSYEALVRGPSGEPAARVFDAVPADRLHAFDQHSRGVAVALASRLGLDCQLNLNLLPQSLYRSPGAIVATLDAARCAGLALERIVIEISEAEMISDVPGFCARLDEYRGLGLKFAIDDFGAGYSGLNLLAAFQPDQVKIDMNLVRGIDGHGPRQAIVRAIAQACLDLGIDVVAEGVETLRELDWFRDQDVQFFQGYLFAKPAFGTLPPAHFPSTPASPADARAAGG